MKMKDFVSISILLTLMSAVVIYEYRASIRQLSSAGGGNGAAPYFKSVTSGELQKMISSGVDFTLIDLRNKEQYDKGHIPGALSIPFPELSSRLDSLDRAGAIVLYCKSGPWSRVSYKDMQAKGFTNTRILQNGIVGWKWEVKGKIVPQI